MDIPIRLHARTHDGLTLSIARVRPRGRPAGALVLQHGLGSNNLGFMLPGVSLAQHMAELGFDCYVPELRGVGMSERPRHSWSIGEYLDYDLPAIIDAVRGESGFERLSWVGHSMGGLLMLMHGIEHPEAPIERLIAVGSTLDYRPGRSVYRARMRLRPLGSVFDPVPFGFFARANALVAGSGPRFLPEAMNFRRDNVDRGVCRLLLTRGFAPIPITLLDSLATTFSDEGFSRDTAEGRIVYLERAGALRIPTLLLGGSRDTQCPEAAVRATFECLTGVEEKQLQLFGRAHGHAAEYGHFDLIVGRRAPIEVWPHMTDFLLGEPARAATA